MYIIYVQPVPPYGTPSRVGRNAVWTSLGRPPHWRLLVDVVVRILSAKEASQHEPSQVDAMDEELAKNTRCPCGLVSVVDHLTLKRECFATVW